MSSRHRPESWPGPRLVTGKKAVRHVNGTRKRRMITMKNFAGVLTVTLLLSGATNSSADCGQLSATLTNLPALNDSGFQVNGLNSAGQLTGFFYIAGVHAGHAFVYGAGNLLDAGTLGGSSSDGYAINGHGWIAGQSQLLVDA